MSDFFISVFEGFLSILLILLPLIIPPLREIILKKFQASLDKVLETHKSSNERKNYISKVRFDKEFEIYQELSEKNLSMVYDCGTAVIIARGMFEKNSGNSNKHLEIFCDDLNDAEMATKKYAPFINEEIYNNYHKLQEKATLIYELYKFWNYNLDGNFRVQGKSYSSDTVVEDIETNQKELSCLSDNILKQVRNYLNSLDVLEDKR